MIDFTGAIGRHGEVTVETAPPSALETLRPT